MCLAAFKGFFHMNIEAFAAQNSSRRQDLAALVQVYKRIFLI